MSTAVAHRTARLAAVALALALAAAAAVGCGSVGAGRPKQDSATTSTTPSPSRAYGFEVDATRAGLPITTAGTPVSLPWFPPVNTDGLQQLPDRSEIRSLEHAAAANSRFWIQRSGSATSPVVLGQAARDLLGRSGGFTTATIVPVAPLDLEGHAPPTFALGEPTSYQVFMESAAGATSFGLRPGAKPGTWLLDSRGELLNWPAAMSALRTSPKYTAAKATVTHTAYGAGDTRSLYLSWIVFSDASGRRRISLLRDLPPTGDEWKIGGQPLRSGLTYPASSLFSTVTAAPNG